MRYLFFLHSSITYLVAKKVVEAEGLPPDKCIFVFTRSLVSEQDGIERIYFELYLTLYDKQQNFWKVWKDIERIDDWVKRVTNNSTFVLFVPHTLFPTTNFIISNALCDSFYYIEEGLVNYIETKYIYKNSYVAQQPKKISRIANFLKFKNRAPITRAFFFPFHKKLKGAFGVSEHAFKNYNFPNRKVVGLPFRRLENTNLYKHIVVLEALNEKGIYNSLAYVMGLLKLIQYFIQYNIKEVHIKFHPYQHEQDYYYILLSDLFNTFSDRLSIIKLEEETMLENIAFSSQAKFYLTSSSAGLYAVLCGREVYSFAGVVEKYDPNFSKVTQALPEWFKDKVIDIDKV